MDPPLLPPPPKAASSASSSSKLRLMVSYGGHILPRANDKTLFYSGGDTRIISLPRTHLSLSSLFSHLSSSLFNGPHNNNNFSLKYQLPSHDLDSLISVSCHEDIINMVDEYDRLAKLPSSSRIRFFLFPNKDDVVSGVVDDCKGGGKCSGGGVDEDWIVDAVKVAGSSFDNKPKDGNCNSNNNNNNDSAEAIVLESNSSFGSSNSSSPISPGNNVSKGNGGDDFKVVLPSLDSFGSDSSILSPNFSQQAIVYQDASGLIDSKLVSANLIDTENLASDCSPRSEILSPIQASNYMIKSMDQSQQLFTPPPPPTVAPQYLHHPPQPNYVTQYYPGSVPIASYGPMYQTFIRPQPVPYHHPQKPYPVYMMPIGQSQNMYDAFMPCVTPMPTVGTNQPLVHRPVMIASPMGYEGYEPVAPPPDYAAKFCGTTSVAPPSMALPPLNQPTQHVSISPVENINCEFEDPIHAQIYKTQPSS